MRTTKSARVISSKRQSDYGAKRLTKTLRRSVHQLAEEEMVAADEALADFEKAVSNRRPMGDEAKCMRELIEHSEH